MANIEIYDRPMCCSTGVCGPEVDPVLPRFASDLEWLKSQGHQVVRFNLAQHPMTYVENKVVHQILTSEGTECLPVILVDGKMVSRKQYPSRDEMLSWVGTVKGKTLLPVSQGETKCCGPKGCC